MKTSSFHRVSAIRQQARAGRSVAQLAAAFGLDLVTCENVLACRTREAAAAVVAVCASDAEGLPIIRAIKQLVDN